jgi:hypothetical protein
MGGVEATFSFTVALEGGEWLASTSVALPPGKSCKLGGPQSRPFSI